MSEKTNKSARYDYRKTKEGRRRFKYKRIYRLTVWLQWFLWKIGIPWHNTFSDECTPDFNCCVQGLAVGTGKCPVCGGHEVESNSPRTTYTCGSSDYDQRPGTFQRGRHCYSSVVPPSPKLR